MKKEIGRFVACVCCGSSWVELAKESPAINCPACFSSARELQKIYDQQTLTNFQEYAQKFNYYEVTK